MSSEMKLPHASLTQKTMIKVALFNALKNGPLDSKDKISAAIEEGMKNWRSFAIAVFGDAAHEYFTRFDRELEQARRENPSPQTSTSAAVPKAP